MIRDLVKKMKDKKETVGAKIKNNVIPALSGALMMTDSRKLQEIWHRLQRQCI